MLTPRKYYRYPSVVVFILESLVYFITLFIVSYHGTDSIE